MIYLAIIIAAIVAAFGWVWQMANDLAAYDDERTL